jgi:DNA-3-methyladenine glycosylase
MYGPPGYAYVYFSYGVHWMLNFVTGPVDFAAAVLIRALEPLEGIALMEARRKLSNRLELTNGPGKICQAMGIGAAEYGLDLAKSKLTVRDAPSLLPITASPRIGITKAVDLPWRFTTASAYVSRPRPA